MGPCFLEKIIDKSDLIDFLIENLEISNRDVNCLAIEEEIPDPKENPFKIIMRWEKLNGDFPLYFDIEAGEEFDSRLKNFPRNLSKKFNISLIFETGEDCDLKISPDGVGEYVCLKYEERDNGIIEIDRDFKPTEEDRCNRLLGKKVNL